VIPKTPSNWSTTSKVLVHDSKFPIDIPENEDLLKQYRSDQEKIENLKKNMQDLKEGRIELVKKLKQKDKTLKNFEKQLDHYPDLHRLKDFPKMKDRVAAIHA
jgi:predicted nuclease with TOPRIM domain